MFPEFAPPQVSIQTEAPGLSPEQVELQVTKPIEDAINGVQGIAAVRSQSIQGLSVITAVLAERVDIHRARQALAERLGEVAGRLPSTVEPPVLTPLTSSSSTVLVVGITSDSLTPMEQRTFVDWVLRPRLLAVPGVSKVAVFGGEVRQLQIQLDPERLRLHGVGIAEVTEAARTLDRRARRRGDRRPNQRLTVRAEGQARRPEELAPPSCGSGTGRCCGSAISAGWWTRPETAVRRGRRQRRARTGDRRLGPARRQHQGRGRPGRGGARAARARPSRRRA